MLVHFPSALFPVGLIADLAGFFMNNANFYLFSFYCTTGGVVFGFMALIFGIIDLLKISPQDKAFNTALTHGGLQFLWLIIFSVLIKSDINNYPSIFHSLFNIILKALLVSGLLFTNYLGGELVLKYGIGKKE